MLPTKYEVFFMLTFGQEGEAAYVSPRLLTHFEEILS